jgi:predicted dithiol-disulfide oxidoreductase (DUF899 family)
MSPRNATPTRNEFGHDHAVVSRAEWLRARKELLAREKAHTHERDALARARRELPWVRVEKDYTFDGPDGPVKLADLFRGKSQLFVYHFMFGPEWVEGCQSCSFVGDHVDGALPHLEHRDVSFVAVSRAPLAKLQAFQRRMGWRFPWVSSHGSAFNFDFRVSATADELSAQRMDYNFDRSDMVLDELPGLSVFFRKADGSIYHTYSAYARGLEPLVGTYQFLDLVPKGRDEDGLSFTMAWVRHHDRYGPDYAVDPAATYKISSKVASRVEAPRT